MSDSVETRAPIEPPPEGFRFSLRSLFIVVFCCALGCAFWVWVVEPAKEADRRMRCVNHLKQIGIGLYNYADVYKHFPPAFAVDVNQKPTHSWRLSIQPFGPHVGGLYAGYDYGRPWDFPANQAITNRFGFEMYRCPSAPPSQPLTQANYVMPIGPHTISDGPNSIAFDQIRDGSSNTIAAGEIANSDIYWTEPRDLPLDAMSFRINDNSKPSISSSHRGVAMVVLADGSVRSLSDNVDPKVLKALLSIDGGEQLAGHKP